MVARKLALFFICLVALAVRSANAQSEARIRIVVPSIDQAEKSLQWLIEQSPTGDLKKQWAKLKEDVLEAFTEGMDLTKPLEIDLVFRKEDMAYEFRIPILKLTGEKGIIPNIEGSGFKVKPVVPGQKDFFEVAEKGKKPVYLRIVKDYGWVSPLKAAVPANLPNAASDMGPLLALKKDVVADLQNDEAGLKDRKDNFQQLRKQFEALIKLHRNEDKNAFELRKLALTQQLDEAERFVVESQTLHGSWITAATATPPVARGEIALTALPGTDLLKSLQEFATKPSYFANVAVQDDPMLSGKLTFPLDPMRVRHLKEFFKAVRPTLETEIAARPSKTDAQKAAMKDATNKFLDMLDAGAGLGVVDSFINTHAVAENKKVLVCGIRVADGNAALDIIKLLPQIQPEWQINPTPVEHGGVSIHELTIPKFRQESFQKIFAGETTLHVGLSKDALWIAAGTDAVKHLNAAIDQVAQPAPQKVDPVFLKYVLQMSQLVPLMEVVQKEAPAGNGAKTKEQQQAEKDLEKFRKLAHEAMGNTKSIWHGELKRTDDKIEGFLELDQNVLKYIGSLIADGVKTTLQ